MSDCTQMSLRQIRKYAAQKRCEDPVYWGEFLHTLDHGFRRPDDRKFRAWLAQQRLAQFAAYLTLDEEWAWHLTDSYVAATRTKQTECYPVLFGALAPIRSTTPRLVHEIGKGHLLLGFITEKCDGIHPASDDSEPRLVVDEAFVLSCWEKQQVEPMLRGCFMY